MIITIDELNYLIGKRAFCSCDAESAELDRHQIDCAYYVHLLDYKVQKLEMNMRRGVCDKRV